MGVKADPANASRMNLFGWNVGVRKMPPGLTAGIALPIVEILALEDMTRLAEIYFDKIDPCYGFIDKERFFELIDARWQPSGRSSTHDAVLAGVAALGMLFSQRTVRASELHLVESARSILEEYDGLTVPSVDLVTGWTLRVLYMRMTAAPYSTWLASSTLMHLIEAAGLRHENSHAKCDEAIRCRLVSVALNQNVWVSHDLGLSKASLKIDQPQSISSRQGDYTAELLSLTPISARVGTEQLLDGFTLQWKLVQTLERVHIQPPSVLAQTNLALCILRRLHAMNVNTSPAITERVLSLFRKALQCTQDLVTNCCPWQHVANVPFHIITVALEMDTYSSLALVPEAMQTMKLVTSTYNTSTMREAYAAAKLLVYLYQQRGDRDVRLLESVFDADSLPNGATLPSSRPLHHTPKFEGMPLLEELVAGMPNLQGLDFDQFLNMDSTRMT